MNDEKLDIMESMDDNSVLKEKLLELENRLNELEKYVKYSTSREEEALIKSIQEQCRNIK